MGVYNNNKDGTRSTIANTIQVVDAPMEQFVSRDEFSAVVPNDTSANNKLVNDDKLDTKLNDIWKVQGELGAKNLIPYPYYENDYKQHYGVIFTAENNTITMSGTSTNYSMFYLVYENTNFLKKGNYIISFDGELSENVFVQIQNSATNIAELYSSKASQSFTIEEDGLSLSLRIIVNPSSTVDSTIKLMVKYASDTDDTWQPYIPTNKALKQELDASVDNIYAIQGRLGSKNLLEQPYASGMPFYSGGMSFTEGNDGGVVINGTSTAYVALQIIRKLEALPHGKYILSVQEDLPSGVVLQFGYVTTSGTITFVQKGYNALTTHSMIVTVDDEFDGNLVCVRIGINRNTTIDNLEIHPMLRYASDTDDTWQPYAPTNYQLNQKLDTIAGVYLPNATTPTSKKVVASVGQTSVTFDASTFMSRYNVTSDDLDLDISAETSSGDVVAYNNVSVTGGIVTVTFDALSEQTTFICKCSVIQ